MSGIFLRHSVVVVVVVVVLLLLVLVRIIIIIIPLMETTVMGVFHWNKVLL